MAHFSADQSRHPPPQSELCSVADTATILGVSAMSIYRKIDAGQIPAVQIGTRKLVPRAWIDDLINTARTSGGVIDLTALPESRQSAQPRDPAS